MNLYGVTDLDRLWSPEKSLYVDVGQRRLPEVVDHLANDPANGG